MKEVEKMNLQDIMNPSKETQDKITALLTRANQTLSPQESAELSSWLSEYDLAVESPLMIDYMRFKGVMEQRAKCQTCRRLVDGCSSREVINLGENRYTVVAVPCPIRTAQNIIKAAEVPAQFQKCRYPDFRGITGEMRTAQIDAAINLGLGLYIYGSAGTGKTMLSSIIINERAYDNRRSHFYTVTDLVADLQDFQNPTRREEKLIKVQTTPCLVIDDIGAEHSTGWVSSALFSVLDSRYKDGLQTIINSNFTVDELCTRYTDYHGERIARRIKSMCKMFYVN